MKYVTAAVATLALAFGGCAGESSNEIGSSNASTNLGSAEAALTLPAGFSINTVTYQVTGNGVNRGPAPIDVTNSSVLRFRIGNLPVANGYTLTLGANTVGTPSYPCAGTVGFNITNTDVTAITMSLTCGGGVTYEVDDKGDLQVSVDVVQGNGTVCPVVTGITALPLETAVGSSVQLEGYSSSAPTSSLWSGSGTFATATTAATSYRCDTGGIHTLTYKISKDGGCTDSSYTVDVECTGPVSTDSGVADTGTPDTGAPDTGIASDSGSTPDTGIASDSGSTPDTSVPDSGPADPFASCLTCMNTSCNDLPDQGLTGLAPVCFQNDPNNTILGTTVPQPKFTQDCTDAVRCSVTAADNCLLGNPAYNPPVAPGDPTLCYCGNQDPNTCASAGPLASSACKTQWEVASACDSITDATLRNQCVAGQIADLSHASGFAYYILGCAATTCASTCN